MVRRICPVCASRRSQVVDPSCLYCLGQGSIVLGASVLGLYPPAVVAEAVRVALTGVESEEAMTLLAITGVIKRPDLVTRLRRRITQVNVPEEAAALPVTPAIAVAPAPDSAAPSPLVPEHSGGQRVQDLLAKPLLTTQEVADVFGVKVGTVENWRYKETGPPAVKLGRQIRYEGQTIRDWINNLNQE